MNEEELNKLRTRLQLAEDSNKILVQKLKDKDKDKDKDIKLLNSLYLKEKKKINTIYSAITTRTIDDTNYQKAVDWIIRTIKEEA